MTRNIVKRTMRLHGTPFTFEVAETDPSGMTIRDQRPAEKRGNPVALAASEVDALRAFLVPDAAAGSQTFPITDLTTEALAAALEESILVVQEWLGTGCPYHYGPDGQPRFELARLVAWLVQVAEEDARKQPKSVIDQVFETLTDEPVKPLTYEKARVQLAEAQLRIAELEADRREGRVVTLGDEEVAVSRAVLEEIAHILARTLHSQLKEAGNDWINMGGKRLDIRDLVHMRFEIQEALGEFH